MKLTSSAFESGGVIPKRYTCDGDDANPPFTIAGVPAETKSLALIMEDPDVPTNIRSDGLWVHWVVWNINPKTTIIAENTVPKGARVGVGTGGKSAYAGPCPPDREHRYFFTLYALDTVPNLPISTTKEMLERVMQGHILDVAEFVGRYDRR